MKPLRLSLRALAIWVAVVGFDLAVLVRAYQQGRGTGTAVPAVVGFGLTALLLNLIALQLGQAIVRIRRLPPGERLMGEVAPSVLLAMYLAVLVIPILAILFLRPGT